MINVSSEFKELMSTRTDFVENAIVTFPDNTVLNLTENDFTIKNNSVVDGSGINSFPLGAAIQRQIQIEIANFDGHLSSYNFVGAKIRLYLSYQLSASVEKIEYGTFTVIEPETYGNTVIVTAVDDMYRADKAFYTTLVYPTTAGQLFTEMCEKCGIEPLTTTFHNDDFIIRTVPSNNLTFRKVFGYLAMIAAGNARIDRFNKLEIKTYDFTVFENTAVIQTLSNFKSLKIGTSDITITGIQTTVKSGETETTYLSGTSGYVLSIENPLISGQEQDAVDLIGDVLNGATFRDFTGDHIAYPIAEFMDPVRVRDIKGNLHNSILTDIDFSFGGFTVFKNAAASAVRNSSKYYTESTKTLIDAEKVVDAERTARETALENLANRLAVSSGLYITADTQSDGSTIYYAHDKPTLPESQFIWKFTLEAIGISIDGGETYPYSLDVSGTAILEKIYAIGIDADYITTGTFTVKDPDGNIVFSADKDTGNVVIAALTAFRNELGEYLRINPEDESITLGSSKSPITLKIVNNRIAFLQNDTEIAWFSNNQLHISQLIVTELADLCGIKITRIGNHIRIS